ncbi:MAG: hypothetical protein AAGA00_14245 [Pseudomonadota bacterium]
MRINKAGLIETVVITAALVPDTPIRDNAIPGRRSATGDVMQKVRWRRHEHV